MTRYIDADALKRKAQKVATEAWKMRIKSSVETILNQFIDWIEAMPTIDAVEVVQCKDCRYQVHCYQTVSHNKIHDGFKEYWSEPIEFCSKGKRREE